MKNGLLLTLKQLIKLGVINLKKKRRKRRLLTTTKSPFTKGDNVNPIDIQGMGGQRYKEFLSASSTPNPQAYSDALRLRDESNNFNTRLLEYKNQQQDQKLLLEDQQQQQQQLQQRQLQIQNVITQGIPIINSLTTRLKSQGFVVDDNVDVTETFGSDDFKTQQDIADPPPPQIPQGPTAQQMYEDIIETLTPTKAPPLALPPPKRGRGRPRKIKT
jgi:hypothetical protein